jgi:hypothetical protein
MLTKRVLACGLAAAFASSACSSSTKSPTGGNTTDASSGGTAGSGGSGGGSGSGGSKGGAGGSGAAGTGGGAGDAGNTVSVSGVVVDFSTADATKNFDATKYPALAGVEVCVYLNTSVPCVTTDATGKYDLPGVPVGPTLYLSYKKTNYTPDLYAVTATAGQNIQAPALLLTTVAYTNSFGTQGGAAVDATRGTILFGATTLGPSSTPFHEMFGTTELFYLQGFKATISPAATVGPVFTSAAWVPDPALTQSSAAGWGFFQATPGDYTLTISHPGFTCGTTTTKVVAGYATTYVGVLCSPLSDAGIADAAPHPG